MRDVTGARAVEGYPVSDSPKLSTGAYTGVESMFRKAGFTPEARRGAWSIVRRNLR